MVLHLHLILCFYQPTHYSQQVKTVIPYLAQAQMYCLVLTLQLTCSSLPCPIKNPELAVYLFDILALSNLSTKSPSCNLSSSVDLCNFLESQLPKKRCGAFHLCITLLIKSLGLFQPSRQIKSVKSQYTRTLELLNERAQLLTQLAELKTRAYQT